MKFTIEMNSLELKEAMENGSLAALVTSLDLGCEKGNGSCGAAASTPSQPVAAKQVPAAPTAVAPNVQPQDPAVPVSFLEPVHGMAAGTEMPQVTTVPTSVKSYTLDDLATAAVGLMDKNAIDRDSLQNLLRSFGVEALPQLPKEQYGNFATALRGLGAQI